MSIDVKTKMSRFLLLQVWTPSWEEDFCLIMSIVTMICAYLGENIENFNMRYHFNVKTRVHNIEDT